MWRRLWPKTTPDPFLGQLAEKLGQKNDNSAFPFSCPPYSCQLCLPSTFIPTATISCRSFRPKGPIAAGSRLVRLVKQIEAYNAEHYNSIRDSIIQESGTEDVFDGADTLCGEEGMSPHVVAGRGERSAEWVSTSAT